MMGSAIEYGLDQLQRVGIVFLFLTDKQNINVTVYLAGFSKRLSTAISMLPLVPHPPNYKVSSSYKTCNCVNI